MRDTLSKVSCQSELNLEAFRLDLQPNFTEILSICFKTTKLYKLLSNTSKYVSGDLN